MSLKQTYGGGDTKHVHGVHVFSALGPRLMADTLILRNPCRQHDIRGLVNPECTSGCWIQKQAKLLSPEQCQYLVSVDLDLTEKPVTFTHWDAGQHDTRVLVNPECSLQSAGPNHGQSCLHLSICQFLSFRVLNESQAKWYSPPTQSMPPRDASTNLGVWVLDATNNSGSECWHGAP